MWVSQNLNLSANHLLNFLVSAASFFFFQKYINDSSAVKILQDYGVCSLPVLLPKANWRPFQIKGGVSLLGIHLTAHNGVRNGVFEGCVSLVDGCKTRNPRVHYLTMVQHRRLIHRGHHVHAPSYHGIPKNCPMVILAQWRSKNLQICIYFVLLSKSHSF